MYSPFLFSIKHLEYNAGGERGVPLQQNPASEQVGPNILGFEDVSHSLRSLICFQAIALKH